MAGDEINCTAHVTLLDRAESDAVRKAVADTLDGRFGIEHCTIQTESAAEPGADNGHLHP